MMNSGKYSTWQITLHWMIVALMVVSFVSHEAIAAVWEKVELGETAQATVGARVHIAVGVTVFVLAIVRLLLRLRLGAPDPLPAPPLQERASQVVHLALYAAIFLIPMSGMAAWFGGATAAADAHEILFKITMLIVLLHVVAAIYHQFVVKDGIFRRIWW